MSKFLKKTLTLIAGTDDLASIGISLPRPRIRSRPLKQLTERELIQKESEK